MVIDDTGSVEDIHAFIYCKKWRFGQVSPMPDRLTDSQSKDSATQLLTKYKSGALVTQYVLMNMMLVLVWAFSMVVVAELKISKLLHASLLQNWYLVENR